MKTEVIPLGTASAIPTKRRHLAATALLRHGRLLLFDCGEGTQFQLLHAGLNLARLDAIFITHFHGDHFYGLPGLLSTLGLLGRREPLNVVGPEGIEHILRSLPGLANHWLPFDIDFVELHEYFEHAVVLENDAFTVEARPVEHRIFAIGFRFEEKPRAGRLNAEMARALGVRVPRDFGALKRGEAVTLSDGRVIAPDSVVGPERPGISFAYLGDTRPCATGVALARGVDLLYHEATFGATLAQNARDTGHSTAREAAEVAREAGAQRLLLGHFSSRYGDVAPLVEEARAVFPNTEAAEELRRYALKSTC